MPKPQLAITMGDPAGVGPEVCLKTLADPATQQQCTPLIFGDVSILQTVGKLLGLPIPETVLSLDEWKSGSTAAHNPAVVDFGLLQTDEITPGIVSATAGQAAFRYIE